MAVTAIDQVPPIGRNVLDLIDAQAERNPDGIAAEFHHKSITNHQLRHASMRVAVELHAQGFKPRDRIPLLTSMGLEMVIAAIGILRLGACYCPMDFAAWSESRVRATLEAVESQLVFSTVETELPGYEIVRIGDLLGENETAGISPEGLVLLQSIRRNISPNDLIYIIFTSGTTGKPKGVMIPHGSVAHLTVQDFPGSLTVYPGARVLLFFSVAFDGIFLSPHHCSAPQCADYMLRLCRDCLYNVEQWRHAGNGVGIRCSGRGAIMHHSDRDSIHASQFGALA